MGKLEQEQKKGIFFLLLSQLSRRTRMETLATQAIIIFAIVLISGRSRGGTRGVRPPLFFDQTEAQRAEKNFYKTRPPPYLRIWMTAPLPLSEGLDPPLLIVCL